MDKEAIAEKYGMKDLRLLAKKPCISTRRATKMDIVKALPPKGLDELEGK